MLLKASSTCHVNDSDTPAVVPAGVLTLKWEAAAEETATAALAVKELVLVSVTVRVWPPAVFSVALRVWTPASPAAEAVVRRQTRRAIRAGDVDGAGVAGGGVVERIPAPSA